MDKKEIQKQRMMKYFIDAAKEIIKEEGVKGVTARKVGEKAGYSYATIYNYFSDLSTLLTYCAFDFLEDCYKHLLRFRDNNINAREQIIQYTLAYFHYFVENPDIFQLIFVEELGKPTEELLEKYSRPSVSILLRESIAQCAKENLIEEEDVDLLGELITSSIHGKLLFFLKRRDAEEINQVINSIKNEIEYLIKDKERKNG
jgi:AcrR family transcriptional regulator